jgi:hypothetical protein
MAPDVNLAPFLFLHHTAEEALFFIALGVCFL